jgi:hypothetical protein
MMGKISSTTKLNWIFIMGGLFCREASAHLIDFVEYLTLGTSLPGIQSYTNSTTGSQPGFSLGIGASIAIRFNEYIDLEASLIYMPRNFTRSSPGTDSLRYSLATLQYPVVAKYWFSENTAVGMGAYYTISLGNMIETQNFISRVLGYNDAKLNNADFGGTALVYYQKPFNDNMSFIGQARILWGITNIDLSQKGSMYNRDLQLMAGIAYRI